MKIISNIVTVSELGIKCYEFQVSEASKINYSKYMTELHSLFQD